MASALVTGASGFVGSNVARELRARGWDVRCLVRSSSHTELLEPLGVELVRGSLDDAASLRAAVAGVDVVFHLAGRTAALRAADFIRDNLDGTRRLAEACAGPSQPPVLVVVSSLAAGGPGAANAPRRESDADQPVSHYGRSKLAAERAAAALADRVPTSIVRPPMVFGDADRATLQLFNSMRLLPLHLNPGLRRFPLSLVHASDLCDALIRVAERGERVGGRAADGATVHREHEFPAGRGVYYVTTDRPVTYAELGQIAAHAAQMAAATMPAPRAVFWLAGMMGEVIGRARGRPALINLDKVREATARGWVCSDAKIRSHLGFDPRETLEERFAQTVAWYRRHGWLK